MASLLRKIFSAFLFLALPLSVYAQPVNDLLHQKNNPVGGNPKGTISVVEFFDYQCSHCIVMAPVLQSIIKINPDVRVVYKDIPIRGPISELAARAALAANKQGKYATLSHALLTSDTLLTEESIIDIAKKNGINVKKLQIDMVSKTIHHQLDANIELAKQLKLIGTPAVFIGKTNATTLEELVFVPGEMSLGELQSTIDKVRGN
ncbi:MAG: hypothetical protein A3F14_03925 [Gammaproteobacteria bacterium RIFCSPHIGHO2_12_FULL_43_28]|nr:MAG: hypothetical protein A3F14_03925 [Gammaproteobacteria bacterium RIFCSPHIGHO2_12_FULL_43_28]